MERQPHEGSLSTSQQTRLRKEEVNLTPTGRAHQPPMEEQNKNNSEGLKRHQEGRKKQSYDGAPPITCSAKSQEEFKRAVDTLGIKYEIVYDPRVAKEERLYDGGGWDELSEDADDPTW